jgi:hypothetical protein
MEGQMTRLGITLAGALFVISAAAQTPQHKDRTLGYDDTPFQPEGKWRVHDVNRPHPRVITPGTESSQNRPGRPPSDAIVLFDGTSLEKWETLVKSVPTEPKWKVENGYMEVVPGTGSIHTKQKFGDIQLHVEWAAPTELKGVSQARGNSGILLMSRYEVQVLDSYNSLTYADGQAAAIYGQKPPLVNACRPPGQWQTYDIVFEAPKFEGDKLSKPAYVTVFQNGVVMHNRQEITGTTPHAKVGTYWLGRTARSSESRIAGALPQYLDSAAEGLRPAVARRQRPPL